MPGSSRGPVGQDGSNYSVRGRDKATACRPVNSRGEPAESVGLFILRRGRRHLRRLVAWSSFMLLLLAVFVAPAAFGATTVASFRDSPSQPVAGQVVTFDGSSSTCASAPCTYAWSDDGADGPGGTNWPLGTGQVLEFTFHGVGTKYVRLTLTDESGDTSTTEQNVAVASSQQPATAPANTDAPAITGTAQQGQTLTASKGTWTGTAPISYTYAWSDGATGATDTLTADDVGTSLTVVVTATNSTGQSSARSASVGPVTPSPPRAPSNTQLPVISGTAQQGQTLTVSNGTWTGSPISYGVVWSDGTTGSSDVVSASDLGQTITATVTATNAGGSTSATSAAVGPVTEPTVSVSVGCAGTPGSGQPNYASLDACGYPSPNTTGVPAGATLTPVAQASLPSGVSWNGVQLTFTASNVTVSGLLIQGTVRFNGSNDTLQNSKVVAGDDLDLVYLSGTSGNTIKNSTIEGIDATTNADFCGRAIHMAGSVPVTVSGVYITNCADGVVGVSHTTDSYIMTNVTYCESACSHDEPIYIPGGGGTGGSPTLIQHNTLFNTQGQTSAVFGDDHTWGPLTNVTVTHNILEGGDYALELGGAGDGDSNIVVTNNSFSRIYFARGALYGPVSGPGGTSPTWSGNIWDNTGQTISP